jgi:hypothetical protein
MNLKKIWSVQFEKLHRYVYDYCYQSNNKDWGKYTLYKQSNINNKLEPFNLVIQKIYSILFKVDKKWRDSLPKLKKYQRYN